MLPCLPIAFEGTSSCFLRLECLWILVLLVVIGVDWVITDVYVHYGPFLQLLVVQLVHVILVSPSLLVVSLDNNVEVILQ